jgi:hypothetical protein
MCNRITYCLRTRELAIQNGRVSVIRSREESRVTVVKYAGRTVHVDGPRGFKTFALPRPAEWRPEPGDIDVERGLMGTEDLLGVLDAVANYPLNASLCLYREERTVETGGFVKRQRVGFYTLGLREESTSYVYADLYPEKLAGLCVLHTLPRRETVPGGLPVIVSSNVTGYIFHEWVHLLESDRLRHDIVPDIEGRLVFGSLANLGVFEDPAAETVGFNAFSDEARIAKRMPLVEGGRLVSFVDSAAFPHRHLGCGYLGYNNDAYPIPRSTNLVVDTVTARESIDRAVVLTSLNLEILSADLLSTRVRVNGGEGVYVEHGVPVYRVNWPVEGETTLQRLVSNMRFLDPSTVPVPAVGGICMKNGISIRSAQSAPPALVATP